MTVRDIGWHFERPLGGLPRAGPTERASEEWNGKTG
jgi:hypothetical protein